MVVLHDQIEPYKGPIQFNLQPGEVPVIGIANVLLSEAPTRSTYGWGYSGVSIRVASGLYSHLGGMRGHRDWMISLQEVGCGYLLMLSFGMDSGTTEKGVN